MFAGSLANLKVFLIGEAGRVQREQLEMNPMKVLYLISGRTAAASVSFLRLGVKLLRRWCFRLMELRVMNRVSWGWGEWRLKAWTPFRRQCYLYAKWQMAGVGQQEQKGRQQSVAEVPQERLLEFATEEGEVRQERLGNDGTIHIYRK